MTQSRDAVKNLLHIASSLSEENPEMAKRLYRSVTSTRHFAAINPGVKKFDQHVEEMVESLKAIDKGLDKGLADLDTEDAAEFAKFFNSMVDSEAEQLRSALEGTKATKVASHVAGPMDFLKNMFKKKEKKPAEEDQGPASSYQMDDATMDDFVDGKSDWADPSHYIEQEFNENKEFFGGADDLLKKLSEAKKSPTREVVQSLKKQVEKLIRFGETLMKGARQHLMEPSKKVEMEDDSPKPAGKKKSLGDLSGTIDHYADMLKDSSGDEKKTSKYLKELFNEVGPLIQEDRATLAAKKILPVLVRVAHGTPGTRKVLLPVIQRVRAASLVQKPFR